MNITPEASELFETGIRGKSNEQLGMELAYSAKVRPHMPGWIYGAGGGVKPVLAERMAKLFCPELSRAAQAEARD